MQQGVCSPKRRRQQLLVGLYANIVDSSKIRDELAAQATPTKAIDEFVATVERAKSHVLAASRDLNEFYELAADLPLEVYRARQEFFAEHQERLARLDELARSLDRPEKVAAIEALRSEYVRACGKFECTSDPFYVEATRALIKGYIAQRDIVSAQAENMRLTQADGYVAGFAQAIFRRGSRGFTATEGWSTRRTARSGTRSGRTLAPIPSPCPRTSSRRCAPATCGSFPRRRPHPAPPGPDRAHLSDPEVPRRGEGRQEVGGRRAPTQSACGSAATNPTNSR